MRDANKPRVCYLEKITNSKQEYGFVVSTSASNENENIKNHFITGVMENSLAFKAGLKKGDLILQINNERVDQIDHQGLVDFINKSQNSFIEIKVVQKL